jgi:SAM-dependent methyltransferase
VRRVIGIDISREMLEEGRCPGMEFLVCDAEGLPFRGRAFDKVVSFTVLQNLADPSKAPAMGQGFVVLEAARAAAAGQTWMPSCAREKVASRMSVTSRHSAQKGQRYQGTRFFGFGSVITTSEEYIRTKMDFVLTRWGLV